MTDVYMVYPDTRHTCNNIANAEILISKYNMQNFRIGLYEAAMSTRNVHWIMLW